MNDFQAQFLKAEKAKNAPLYASTYSNRGWAYFMKGDDARALADLNEAIRIQPNTATYYSSRSQIYHKMGDAAKAKQDRDKAQEFGLLVPEPETKPGPGTK